MAKDMNFEIPVTNGAYKGSDRASSGVKAATSGGNPTTPGTSGDPSASTQSDKTIKNPNDSLKMSSNPLVLTPNAKPISGGTPPNMVNPEGRPGLNAKITPKARF